MIKLLWLIFCLQAFTLITAKINNSNIHSKREDNKVESWTGNWFPNPPSVSEEPKKDDKDVDSWTGNWFPGVPSSTENAIIDDKDVESWTGKWFPYSPSSTEQPLEALQQEQLPMGECDDGHHNIGIDFDPNMKTQNYNYLCLANRTKYDPNLNTEPVLIKHLLPPAFNPSTRCINETISYDDDLPTFGSYRVLSPKFGTYLYLPPQRWMRSLAEGAIVLLYHPCAFKGQVSVLQNIVKSCLYRHIISPSQNLSPERPMALLAWGKCLQMSVVDKKTVVNFIKENAKGGPLSFSVGKDNKYYEVGLLKEAHLVTSLTDAEICGYNEM